MGERRTEAVIADKGYGAEVILAHIQATGAIAVIPPKRNRKQPRQYDISLYKQRNRTERCFSKLKRFRGFATRYEKSKACFHALVALACSWLILLLAICRYSLMLICGGRRDCPLTKERQDKIAARGTNC